MNDTDPIPLSALNHWAYCPRRCCLIHMEGEFSDNIHTARGIAEHRRADEARHEASADRRSETALPVWSDRLGLVGKCDVVEFLADGTPYPVEYKHGSRHKAADIAACDDVQLAAQALCLTEMTGHAVDEGALYYASSKRRRVVAIDDALRERVRTIAAAVRQMLAAGTLPAPTADARRCRGCSLHDRCQPEAIARARELARSGDWCDPDR